MVLQRIQTVYLLIAVIVMAVFTFFPVFAVQDDSCSIVVGAVGVNGTTSTSLPLLVLDVLITVMCFITIFKYRDLRGQIRLATINIVLIVVLIATIAVMVCQFSGSFAIELGWAVVLPVLALLFVFLARRGMSHDKKLLADSERIR